MAQPNYSEALKEIKEIKYIENDKIEINKIKKKGWLSSSY